MTVVSPYRLTPEDLPDLDSKTRNGLAPLTDALNVTLPQLVAAAGAVTTAYADVTLVTGAVVADSFPLRFRNPLSYTPRWVAMSLRPKDPDHVLTTPFAMQGWSLTDNNLISVPFITGLTVDQTFFLTFEVR